MKKRFWACLLYTSKRRTAIENAEEAVYEENKIEEQEVVFLMDRFGYAKTVDTNICLLYTSRCV